MAGIQKTLGQVLRPFFKFFTFQTISRTPFNVLKLLFLVLFELCPCNMVEVGIGLRTTSYSSYGGTMDIRR